MKIRYLSIIGICLSLLGSCIPESQDLNMIIPGSGELVKITAYADNVPQTKTGLVDKEGGGKSVVWKSGNAISLFFNSGTAGGNQFTTTSNGPIAEFLGNISAVSGDLSGVGGQAYFWGLYPYNPAASCDGTTITTSLPANQLAYQGDVADDLLVTVGRSENLSIHFKNACSVIGFTLTQENISKVVFSGNAGEKVAGEFKISFDGSNKLVDTPTENAVESITITPAGSEAFQTGVTYYFATLPGTFSEGYSLEFAKTNSAVGTYQQPSSITLKASSFYTMADKDHTLWPKNNEIWYKTSNGEVLSVSSNASFGANLISNTYSDGIGIMTFDADVTSISSDVFDTERLTYVSLPESLQEIGYRAFAYSSIESIRIPESVTIFGDGAFAHCSKLKLFEGKNASEDGKMLILTDQTDGKKILYAYADPEATSINISPSGIDVDYVGDDVFAGHQNLKTIYCDCECGMDAFYGCEAAEDITIRGSATNSFNYNWGGEGYFPKMRHLTILNSDHDVYYNLGTLGWPSKLESLTLPEGVIIHQNSDTDRIILPVGCKIYGPHASSDNTCWIVDGDLQLFAFPKNTHYYRLPSGINKISANVFFLFTDNTGYYDDNHEYYYWSHDIYSSDGNSISYNVNGNVAIIVPDSVTEIDSPILFQMPTFFESETPPRITNSDNNLIDPGMGFQYAHWLFVPGNSMSDYSSDSIWSAYLNTTISVWGGHSSGDIDAPAVHLKGYYHLPSEDLGLTDFSIWDEGLVYFADDAFKAYCVENFDEDGDGELSLVEAGKVKAIDCHSKGIQSLDGIEYFANITTLNCSDNSLTSLYVYNNPALTVLNCSYNRQLTSLDVSNNTLLTKLQCYGSGIKNLNVSNNEKIETLVCYDNDLSTLDVSNCPILSDLHCYRNPHLTEIWLKNGQTISYFAYDTSVATIKYKN